MVVPLATRVRHPKLDVKILEPLSHRIHFAELLTRSTAKKASWTAVKDLVSSVVSRVRERRIKC